MVIIKKLRLLGCPAEVLKIEMDGLTAKVTITPGLIAANFTPTERERFLKKIARLVTIHIDWPRHDGQPVKAKRIKAGGTASILVYKPTE